MKRSRHRTVEALREAHAALHDDLSKLETVAHATTEKSWQEVCARLSATHALVMTHFRLEEQDGYMDAVRKRQPRLERTIRQLEDEHQQLTYALEALLLEAHKSSDVSADFRAKVLAWIEQLRKHEHRENALVQEAYEQDLGTED
jgi:hypothetical protein